MPELEQIEQRLNKLEAENERLRNRMDELEAENEHLRNEINELEGKNDQLRDRVDEVEGNVDAALGNTKGAFNKISQLKDRLANLDATPKTETSETTVQKYDTSLEQVCALPDHIAEDTHSPNQLRARHIALNLGDYATKTPKGYVLRTSDIRTVLKARFDTSHSETVNRVREFFDDLGSDLVEVREPQTAGYSPDKKGEKKRQGKKIVVDEQLAYSLHRISQNDHNVVTESTA